MKWEGHMSPYKHYLYSYITHGSRKEGAVAYWKYTQMGEQPHTCDLPLH